MQKRRRTTNGEEVHFLGVPSLVADPQTAPQLQVEIVHLQRRGMTVEPHESDALSRMVIKSGTGMFTYRDSPMNGDVPLYRSPFTPEEAKDVMLRHERYRIWLPYGFMVKAYSITLFFYNASNTASRGVVELGREFSSMQVNLTSPDGGRHSVHIGRNRLMTRAPFKRLRTPYISCQATIAYRPNGVNGGAISIKPQNFDGIDTLYLDRRAPDDD